MIPHPPASVTPLIASRALREMVPPQAQPLEPLSEREREVLVRLAQAADIARRPGLVSSPPNSALTHPLLPDIVPPVGCSKLFSLEVERRRLTAHPAGRFVFADRTPQAPNIHSFLP